MALSTVLIIEKREMFKALHEEHALSDRFISFMLARIIRIEEDLVDQLFNSGENRNVEMPALRKCAYPSIPEKRDLRMEYSGRVLCPAISLRTMRLSIFPLVCGREP